MTDQLPHLIGICGNPGSGKSLVQEILYYRYGVKPVDDGFAIRSFAMEHLGLSAEDVYSQSGKRKTTVILGKEWQNRDILGTFGKHMEAMLGNNIFPWIAVRKLDPNFSYSFGSVRRDQGHFYRERGGVVIGVSNSEAPPSPYDFDQFDSNAVDYWIKNDFPVEGVNPLQARNALEQEVDAAVKFISKVAGTRAA